MRSKGLSVNGAIYALSETYSEMFQSIFDEQLFVAKTLGINDVPTIEDGLKNRPKKVKTGTVTGMSWEIYENHIITFSGADRRITEASDALLFFKTFAHVLGIRATATTWR